MYLAQAVQHSLNDIVGRMKVFLNIILSLTKHRNRVFFHLIL